MDDFPIPLENTDLTKCKKLKEFIHFTTLLLQHFVSTMHKCQLKVEMLIMFQTYQNKVFLSEY